MRQLFLPVNDLTNRLTAQMDVFSRYPAPIGSKDASGRPANQLPAKSVS
jgi:hypothetical protein